MERVGDQEDIVNRSAALGITPYQALIIASMIEREAKVPEDRAKIARVIYNRLGLSAIDPENPIPLQIDATVLYGRDQAGLDPDLPFSELRQIDGPYNTYLRRAFPRPRSPTRAARRSRRRSTRRPIRPPATRSVPNSPIRRSVRTSTTSSPTRTVATSSPRSSGSTNATSSWPARPACCDVAQAGGTHRVAGRAQPVAGHPPGRLRRGRCRLDLCRVRCGRRSRRRRCSTRCASSESPVSRSRCRTSAMWPMRSIVSNRRPVRCSRSTRSAGTVTNSSDRVPTVRASSRRSPRSASTSPTLGWP